MSAVLRMAIRDNLLVGLLGYDLGRAGQATELALDIALPGERHAPAQYRAVLDAILGRRDSEAGHVADRIAAALTPTGLAEGTPHEQSHPEHQAAMLEGADQLAYVPRPGDEVVVTQPEGWEGHTGKRATVKLVESSTGDVWVVSAPPDRHHFWANAVRPLNSTECAEHAGRLAEVGDGDATP